MTGYPNLQSVCLQTDVLVEPTDECISGIKDDVMKLLDEYGFLTWNARTQMTTKEMLNYTLVIEQPPRQKYIRYFNVLFDKRTEQSRQFLKRYYACVKNIDKTSRQLVVPVWSKKWMSCQTHYQFLYRSGILYLFANFRSLSVDKIVNDIRTSIYIAQRFSRECTMRREIKNVVVIFTAASLHAYVGGM